MTANFWKLANTTVKTIMDSARFQHAIHFFTANVLAAILFAFWQESVLAGFFLYAAVRAGAIGAKR